MWDVLRCLMFSIFPVDRLSIITTSLSLDNSSTRLDPIKPSPPVTATFLFLIFHFSFSKHGICYYLMSFCVNLCSFSKKIRDNL